MQALVVTAIDGYRIRVSFIDGTTGIVELSDFIEKGIFRDLKDENLFRKVYISGSAIAWSDELEIDTDAIYAEIIDKEPAEIFHQ